MEDYAKYIELADSLGYTGAEKAKWVEKKIADAIEREDRALERAFKPQEESVETYLILFEQTCKSFNYSSAGKAQALLTNLTGETIAIIASMSEAEKEDYDLIKERLMKHFGKTEDYYRKTIRDARINNTGDINQIIFDIRKCMNKRLESAEIDLKKPEAIIELNLIDHVLNNATDSLFTFLRERKIRTQKQLTEQFNIYKDAHPGAFLDKREQGEISAAVYSRNSGSDQRRYGNNNRDRSNSAPTRWKPDSYTYSRSIECYHCGKTGHVKSECFSLKSRDTYLSNNDRGGYAPNNNYRNQRNYYRQRQYSGQSRNEFHNQSRRPRMGPDNRGENRNSRNNNQVTSAGVEGSETVASVRQSNLTLKMFPAIVNIVRVMCLRDSGCTCIIVKKSLVRPEQYIPGIMKMTYANKKFKDECEIAVVDIDSAWLKGKYKVAVMEEPIADMIIGNAKEVKESNEEDIDRWESQIGAAVETRAQKQANQGSGDNEESKTELIEDINEWIKLQEEDNTFKNILKNINTSNMNVRGSKYTKENNVLVRKYIDNKNNEKTQIVVPQTMGTKILQQAHDSPLGAHMAEKNTFERIAEDYYWPLMEEDIKKYIQKCTKCIRLNPVDGKHNAPLQQTDRVTRVSSGHSWTMEHPTSQGHKFILTIVDWATRWPEAIPLREITAVAICDAVMSVCTRSDFPDTILSDNGTQFKGKLTKAFTSFLNIAQVHSTIYHPQANGINERWNKTLKTMLKKVTEDHPGEWHKYFPQVLFAYRGTKHESTGFSPFELIYGVKPKGPLTLLKHKLLNKHEEEFDPHELVNQTRERIVYGVQTAQENAQLASERHRNIKNKHRYLRTFERGDLVFVKLPDRKNTEAFQGPFEVIKKLSDVNYEINIKGNNTPIHIDRIKKLYVEPEKLIEKEHMACTIISESCNTHEIKTNHIPVNEKNIIDKIVNEYKDVITTEMGFTETIQHKIELTYYSAMKGKHYQVPVAYREAVEAELDILLESGQIERTESAYSSPMVIVRKKNNKVRICCDY
ncbi:uncharacterized protein LOC131943267 [Physella acuta]|uniref:uncharacterized protein LOC131943267 n=1 Tax=Physella acuta TaxID=109671 RepID=UPI0027DCABE7|nr:uncharacterized protein LOC131943267 [Physella acuta]